MNGSFPWSRGAPLIQIKRANVLSICRLSERKSSRTHNSHAELVLYLVDPSESLVCIGRVVQCRSQFSRTSALFVASTNHCAWR